MKLTKLTHFLFIAALFAVGSVQAGLPVLPEILVTLPDAVQKPLVAQLQPLALRKQTLIDEGRAINQQCTNVEKGSSQHQDCLARQARFNDSAKTLRTDVDALADKINVAVRAFCGEATSLADRLEKEGLEKLDINLDKTRKMIKQAEEGKSEADTKLVSIAGDAVAGELVDKMEDFATNHKTIFAMKKKLQQMTANPSNQHIGTKKLKAWLELGIGTGNAVIDSYEVHKKTWAIKGSDPSNATKKQMLSALAEYNEKFLADTGAWELAGEHLSKALGPAGNVAFKTTLLGIKVAANRGAKMISENDLNEQKYHLGNMMKIRAEMAQKVKTLRKQVQEKCTN